MKLTCVALLACSSFAFAEGDDDLGLPQLNAPVPTPAAAPLKLEVTKPAETPAVTVVDDVVIPVEHQSAPETAKLPPTVTTRTTTVTPQVSTVAPAAPVTILPIAPPPPAPARPPQAVAVQPAPAAQTSTAPAMTATATYVYPNYSNYGAPTPDRAGPMMDSERSNDRTRRPDLANYRDDVTRQGRDYQRPPTKTRPGTDDTKPRDITQPRPNDYRFRDRTQQGPDDLRPADITRRRDR